MGTNEEDYPSLYAGPPSNEELTQDIVLEGAQLHTTAENAANYHTFKVKLGNELATDLERKFIEYTEADIATMQRVRDEWNQQYPLLEANWKADEGKSMSAAEALIKARQNSKASPSMSPTGRMPPSVTANHQPQFQNSRALQGWPGTYVSATSEWQMIEPTEFERMLFDHRIVRVPDFDRPNIHKEIAVLELDRGPRLAIGLRRSLPAGDQQIHAMTHSNKILQGRLDLMIYRHPSGQMALDLFVDMPSGRHTIARTQTTHPHWVLPFYKEIR